MAPASSSMQKQPPSFLHSAGHHVQSLAARISSHLPSPNPSPSFPSAVILPFFLVFPSSSIFNSIAINDESKVSSSSSSSIRSRFSSSMRIDGLRSGGGGGGGGGPAFVGQVFSMLDPSGNGLMTVTSHFDIPFISKRTPEWIKKILATVFKQEQSGPVFRFFMDLSDAVAHFKRSNIPIGMVGACCLDVAYQRFKEDPRMFQFVPNEKQVKAANRLLKEIPTKGRRRKVDGVSVFTAQNLNIAIATNDGIKWQRDVIDDSLTTEVIEENGDSLFESPEVQEVLDELGHSGIPLGVLSKAAEIQLLDVVDKLLLGDKWLRKASGIQPKFPYLVDSFEKRSAVSFPKATALTCSYSNSMDANNKEPKVQPGASEFYSNETSRGQGWSRSHIGFQFPFGDWLSNPWSRLHENNANTSNSESNGDDTAKVPSNPLLPKITMVGISMGEAGQVSKSDLKKTMEDLTKELEQSNQKSMKSSGETDPLFVSDVGDYSSITRMNSLVERELKMVHHRPDKGKIFATRIMFRPLDQRRALFAIPQGALMDESGS